ncbi:glycosyltransferase [Boudabousia marimammalium]|uniref:Glycosyl transferase family 28 C-terminal domain-containing protein n=1 Tax=Boudabousia marimammalium TaxID=156892 RepID=A0A1Q5PS14_9ACTO|nr:glycosyltransferase [Boudabousia marimammalium]OKL50222.1 hypothetical protein BM477_02175 [Boudabousia marimammalium]
MSRRETELTLSTDGPCVVFMTGTHHLGFPRMVKMALDYAQRHPAVTVVLQSGSSSAPEKPFPANLQVIPYLTRQQSEHLQEQASLLITQGGPSIMMEWVRSGHHPLVLPRRPELGEHVDEHQVRFAQFAQRHGLAQVIEDLTDIPSPLPARAQNSPSAAALQIDTIGSPIQSAANLQNLVSSLIAAHRGNFEDNKRRIKNER